MWLFYIVLGISAIRRFHKSLKFPAYLGSQLSILAVISSRPSFETAAISIAGVIAAQSPDHNGCAWGERSVRFKIHPKIKDE